MRMQRCLAEPWEAGSSELEKAENFQGWRSGSSRRGCAKLVAAANGLPDPFLIPEFFPINTGGETHQEKQPWESAGSEG